MGKSNELDTAVRICLPGEVQLGPEKHAGSTNPVKICLIAKCQILKTTKPTLQNTQHHTLSYRHTHRHTLTHTHTYTQLGFVLTPGARTHFYNKF